MCECCKPKTCEKGKDPKTCTEEQIKECHGDRNSRSGVSSGAVCGDRAVLVWPGRVPPQSREDVARGQRSVGGVYMEEERDGMEVCCFHRNVSRMHP